MKRITALVAVLALAAPAAASAESSTCQAYNPQLCTVATTPSSTAASGTLPFTGLDVALLAAGGGGLLGIGLVVRRFSSHPHS